MIEFKLFNTEKSIGTAKKIAKIHVDRDGKDYTNVFETAEHLIFYSISKGKTKDTEYQVELPKEIIPWLEKTIQNTFWKKPSEGGLPKNQHAVKALISGEEIVLSRSMNAGVPGEKGFKIVNNSRKSHILSFRPQQLQITDQALVNDIFPLLNKAIIDS